MLAEGIDIEGAWLKDGLLHVDLRRPQPEVRVKTIPINGAQARETRVNGAGRPVVDGRASRE